MKPLLVVNPTSGGGATGRSFAAIRSTVERALGEVDVVTTARPGDGIELARRGAVEGHPLVVAVGGDGTIHEVVNGLMRGKAEGAAAELGIIGQGTGGDFRKTLGIEHRLDRYLEALASGRRRPIDVGAFTGGGKTGHYFVNILSVGLGGLVDRYVATASRALGGKAAYFGASLKALLNAHLGRVRVTTTAAGAHGEETVEHEVASYMIAICNGRFFGGGMKVAPMAELDDGTFEIVALGATSKLGFAMTSGSIYSGAHIGTAGTVHLRARKVKLELINHDASQAFLLDVDGEPMGALPLEIELVPKAITLRG